MGRRRDRAVAHQAVAALIALAVLAFSACNGASSSEKDAAVGTKAPVFVTTDVNGKPVRLDDFAGHPVLVNFWASWCHPCRQEFPLLAGALTKYRSRGLEIVGVSFEDIPGDARTFVAQEHADWTFARDDDGTIAGAYGVRPIPETFFVRRDGTLAGRLLEIPSARQLDASLQGILGT